MPSRPKRCSCYLAISGVTGPILIIFVHNVATIRLLNISESKLPYSYPFRNTSLPNKGHFANFSQNWLPWQRPLRTWKKMSRSIVYLSFGEKVAKIGPVDPEIICLQAIIKKEINASKIYSLSGKFAELAKQICTHTHRKKETKHRNEKPCNAVNWARDRTANTINGSTSSVERCCSLSYLANPRIEDVYSQVPLIPMPSTLAWLLSPIYRRS